MKRTKLLMLSSVMTIALLISACSNGSESPTPESPAPETPVEQPETPETPDTEGPTLGLHDDGTYRGIFMDGGDMQVSIQFTLTDNVLNSLSYRHLYYGDTDYRAMEEGDALYGIKTQHEAILEYLDGKPLDTLFELYETAEFVEDVDAFTGATIRGSKLFSAFKDGLNRGLYSPANGFSRTLDSYENGTYRGIYGDSGEMQVSIQFALEDGVLKNLSFRHLAYRGTDYRRMEENDPFYGLLTQHQQVLEYLDGKPLETIFDLYVPGDFVEDVDTFSGATIRGNKILSAIRDGLNRGIYSPSNGFTGSLPDVEDGRYRGSFSDSGYMQVNVQFSVENGNFTNLTYRYLYYGDTDYRGLEEGDALHGILVQYNQVLEYLDGKPVSAVFDLFTPGDYVDDVDSFTGATLRANKVISAIIDGMNRGKY